MGATCELRRISAADAQYFLQNPLLLARQLKAEAEQHYANLQRLGYAAYEANRRPNPDVQHYDWVVLVAQTAGSHDAWRILVQESQVVGGLVEQYLMEGEARILLLTQVQALAVAMRSAVPLAELYPDQPADILTQGQLLRQGFESFLRETAETHRALLLVLGP